MKRVNLTHTPDRVRSALPLPPQAPGKRRIALPTAAACLCLAMFLLCLAPLLAGCDTEPVDEPPASWTPEIGEDIPEMGISAELKEKPDYIFSHGSIIVQMGQYSDLWFDLARKSDVESVTPIPDCAYLPIYAQTTPSLEEELDSFIQRTLPMMRALTGSSKTDYTIQHPVNSAVSYPDSYNASMEVSPGVSCTFEGIVNDCLTFTCPVGLITEAHYFRDIVLAPPIDTDEEILASLVHTLDYLTETTGLSFAETTLRRRELGDYISDYNKLDVNDVVVTMVGYPRENPENLPLEIASIPAYTLTVRYRYRENRLVPESLIYREPLYDGAHTVMVGKAKAYTLAEAEALLEAGYVYSAMACLDCRKRYVKTDFSSYDAVGLVYMKNRAGIYNRSIPFYAFYKLLGQDEEGEDIYAAACVPAVPFDGMEDYFAERTRKHRH